MKSHNPKQDDYFNSDPPYLDNHFMKHSTVYKEFLAERNEILKHKWLESEKEGSDIGFERALLDWIRKHRANWRKQRKRD
jgi:hypothetical protein